MARDVTDSMPLSSREELIAWMAAGEKPQGPFLLGAEHEKIPFYVADDRPVPYTGGEGAGGVEDILKRLQARNGWAPIFDGQALIGLHDEIGGGAISLEPGGQFELSGAPLDNAHQTLAEFDAHLADLKAIADPLGIGFLDLGMSPLWSREETPIMPKQRYDIMRAYMPKVGTRGLDMMFRTATVQVNLDFASEADMVAKMRVCVALQPVVTALFANSPFTDGRPNGFLSMRSEIWRHTDAARTGMTPFVFEPGMGYESYVDFALAAPMYFVKRGEIYHNVAGARFMDLVEGRLPQLPGERATLSDWANHLSTVFPEVRLKRYLEMRGADVGPRAHIAALSALFAGLLYDSKALDEAGQFIRDWTAEQRQSLRDEVPRLGLAAHIGGRPLDLIARQVLEIAEGGLRRRARLNAQGDDETQYLQVLRRYAEDKRPLAGWRLHQYFTSWGECIAPAFRECVF